MLLSFPVLLVFLSDLKAWRAGNLDFGTSLVMGPALCRRRRNWNRSNFCWIMFQYKRRRATLASAQSDQTLHPIFLNNGMGKVEDP